MTSTTTQPSNSTNPGPSPAIVVNAASSGNQPKPIRARIAPKWLPFVIVIVLGIAAYFVWKQLRPAGLPQRFSSSNGRIEATEIDIATKIAGRLAEEFVNEGDLVSAQQVLARIDTEALNAQLREAQAELRRTNNAVETANSGVSQRKSEKAAAERDDELPERNPLRNNTLLSR